ncbi:MAG: hypothetical protein ACIAQU_04320 [Phycisphaerales bacterium JB064]
MEVESGVGGYGSHASEEKILFDRMMNMLLQEEGQGGNCSQRIERLQTKAEEMSRSGMSMDLRFLGGLALAGFARFMIHCDRQLDRIHVDNQTKRAWLDRKVKGGGVPLWYDNDDRYEHEMDAIHHGRCEAAYRRGFQQGMVCAQGILKHMGLDGAAARLDYPAKNLAESMRFDGKPHTDYMNEIAAKTLGVPWGDE